MKKTLSSGVELDITLAPFGDAYSLLQSVMHELRFVEVNLGLGYDGRTLASLLESEVSDDILNTIKNLFISQIASKSVHEKLLPCLQRCTYGGLKISGYDFFEPELARNDYLEVVKEVLVFNLLPFLKKIGLLLPTAHQVKEPSSTQKSR